MLLLEIVVDDEVRRGCGFSCLCKGVGVGVEAPGTKCRRGKLDAASAISKVPRFSRSGV